MSNQFYYKRITFTPAKEEGGEKETHVWNDSFNINKVIRSMEFEKETIVLLDDGHEAASEVPMKDKRGQVEYKRVREWLQSEIHMTDKDDISRWKSVSRMQGDYGQAKMTTMIEPKLEEKESV